jgi:hypothetical protein
MSSYWLDSLPGGTRKWCMVSTMRIVVCICIGGLLHAASCTVPNPGYSPGEADAAPIDLESSDTASGEGVVAGDIRPWPDRVPWQCQKEADCADNLSCTVDSCGAKKTCEHTLKADTCVIGGVCYPGWTANPKESCQACVVSQSTTSWTNRANGTPCDADAVSCTVDSCSNGQCTHPIQDGACLISNHCYWAGDANPTNSCEACDPSSPTKWTSTVAATCYKDEDGDGVGVNNVSQTSCTCAAGWSSKSGDCDDDNADVFPGQTAYFVKPYPGLLGDSWDYNCNFIPEPKHTSIGYCYKSGSTCKWQPGWAISSGLEPPTCGVTKNWITACTMTSGYCNPTVVQYTQACR